jgi:hypothetical protein
MHRASFRGAVMGTALASALALTAASSMAASTLPTLTLAVTKNSITVTGQKVSGAVQIDATVSGEASDNPALILLKPGVTAQEFGRVVSKLGDDTPLDAIDPYGTIVYSSGTALKGQTTTTDAVLPPGNYVAVNNGNGHSIFKITRSARPATLPHPAATVTAIDFAFRGASTLHDGELVRFMNQGYLVHMFEAAQGANVAAAKKAEAALLAGNTKAAKKYVIAAPMQLAGPLSSGQSQESVITAPPGVYVIFCAMNAQDGRDHYQLGMFRTIRIVN